MVGDVTRPKIVLTPGLIADNEGYALSLIERGLCMQCGAKEQIRCKKEE
jgi:hypothetical protein